MYQSGQGVTQNYSSAVFWYNKSAEQGLAVAQANLGVLYAFGKGVSQNYVQSYKWLDLASAANITAAQRNRDKIAKMMSPTQIKEGKKLASMQKLNILK
jgi:hypothetical protein